MSEENNKEYNQHIIAYLNATSAKEANKAFNSLYPYQKQFIAEIVSCFELSPDNRKSMKELLEFEFFNVVEKVKESGERIKNPASFFFMVLKRKCIDEIRKLKVREKFKINLAIANNSLTNKLFTDPDEGLADYTSLDI